MKMFKGNYPKRAPKSLTEQQIFDTVCEHLKNQNKKSQSYCAYNKEYICKFRTEDGLACAVGCLMTNKEAIEADNAIGCVDYNYMLPERFHEHSNFLLDLQEVHDKNKPSRWAQKLRVLGKSYELDISKAKW